MTDHSRSAPDSAPGRPREIDLSQPSASRVYDYYLGGNLNFEVDREFAETVLDNVPSVTHIARHSRAFLQRAVAWLSSRGITQFLDIGSGVTTVGNAHEIAEKSNPRAHTVHVDYDPVVVARASNVLDDVDPQRERTNIIQADLREPEEILRSESVQQTLDLSRPVALLMVATLQFIGPGDGLPEVLSQYRRALADGSYLALSHLTMDGVPHTMRQQGKALEELYAETRNPGYFRDRAEFAELFGDFELVEPGVVWAPEWNPIDLESDAPAHSATLVGVSRKNANR